MTDIDLIQQRQDNAQLSRSFARKPRQGRSDILRAARQLDTLFCTVGRVCQLQSIDLELVQ